VERTPEWKTHLVPRYDAVQTVGVLACGAVALVALGLGWRLCVGLSVLPFFVTLGSPFTGMLAALAVAIVGVLAAGWRLLDAARRSPRSAGWVVATLGLVGGILAWTRTCGPGLPRRPLATDPKPTAQGAANPAVLLGYSAVAGSALRGDSP